MSLVRTPAGPESPVGVCATGRGSGGRPGCVRGWTRTDAPGEKACGVTARPLRDGPGRMREGQPAGEAGTLWSRVSCRNWCRECRSLATPLPHTAAQQILQIQQVAASSCSRCALKLLALSQEIFVKFL